MALSDWYLDDTSLKNEMIQHTIMFNVCAVTGPKDICQTDKFVGQCRANEIIIMKRALYGRMKIGKCVEESLGELPVVTSPPSWPRGHTATTLIVDERQPVWPLDYTKKEVGRAIIYTQLSLFGVCRSSLISIDSIACALRLGPTQPVTNFCGWQMSSSYSTADGQNGAELATPTGCGEAIQFRYSINSQFLCTWWGFCLYFWP